MSSFSDRFGPYVVRNRTDLLGFIRNKVGDEALAEDILQDSLFKALRAAPEIEEEDLATWLYRIIRNAITNAYRRHAAAARRLERHAQEKPEPAMSPEEREALCRCFLDLLPTLKPEYAELIEAMDLGGLTTNEMTEQLGITAGNLKVRHHRARRQLRERLEETCRYCLKHGCFDCTCKALTIDRIL